MHSAAHSAAPEACPGSVLGGRGSLLPAPGLPQPLPWFTWGVSRFFPIPQPWRLVHPVASGSGSITRWTRHTGLSCRGAWAGAGAEALGAVSMQGWQLAGGWASPHSFYFCCLCHMGAMTTDDVIRLVPPCYFCINLWVCVAVPLPAPRVLQGLGSTCPLHAGGANGAQG